MVAVPPRLPYKISDYRINSEKLEAVLGPLESKVMDTIWQMPTEVTVREVHSKMSKGDHVAYTTVMSTMNTLHGKGLLDRKIAKGRGGLHYAYWPAFGKESFERSAVRQVIDSLARNFGDSVASYLIERATSDESKTSLLKKALDEKLKASKAK